MASKIQSTTPHLLVVVFLILFANLTHFAPSAAGQKASRAEGEREDALFLCLSQKLGVRPGELRDIGNPDHAFDAKSGRNFVYDHDKQAWVDTKTLQAVCTPAEVEDWFFLCLSQKLGVRPGELRDIGNPDHAFDAKSGRNFVYDHDKQAWID